jgi:DNA-binding transcriptional regulator GbsR (MarR family)
METLSPVAQRFILHWGEMGTRWGINRTVAQIHALLYLSPQPLAAEQIAATLSVARSNVSNSLKELQGWGVVRTVHELGDRKDRFESLKDVWEMFSIILEERKRREIDPTLQMLRSCASELEDDGAEKYTRKRVEEMLEFFESVTSFYGEFRRLPLSAVRRLGKLKGKLRGLFGSARAKEG